MPCIRGFEFASLVVAPSSTTINAVTSYNIYYNRAKDDNFADTDYDTIAIKSTDNITVTFPSTYSLTTITCSVSVNSGLEVTPTTCSISGNKVIAIGVVSADTYIATISFTISNIQNPSPAILTDYFTGTIGTDTSGSGLFSSEVQLDPD